MTTQKGRPGPRPRYGTPMPRTAITAPPDDLTFFMLYGGDGTMSAGIRTAIARLLKLDNNAVTIMKQAQWMTQRAEQLLREDGEEVSQKSIYRYLADNYMRILADWQDQNGEPAAE